MDKLGIGVAKRIGKYDVYIGVIGLSLLLGCVAGVVTASFVEDIGRYFSPADELLSGFSFVSVLNRFLSLYKFHFMAAFLGFTLFGVFLLPVFAVLRGFFISFSVAAVCGAYSFWPAVALFGLSAIYSLPSFLIMSVVSMEMAGRLFSATTKKKPLEGIVSRNFLLTLLITTIVLLLGSLFDCWLTPKLFEFAVG